MIMAGAKKAFDYARKEHFPSGITGGPLELARTGNETLELLFTPDTSKQDEMAERQLKVLEDLASEEKNPVTPIPDTFELERARRRRGRRGSGGFQSTILTDRLGG